MLLERLLLIVFNNQILFGFTFWWTEGSWMHFPALCWGISGILCMEQYSQNNSCFYPGARTDSELQWKMCAVLYSGVLALIGLVHVRVELKFGFENWNLGLSAVLVQSFGRQKLFHSFHSVTLLSLSILNKFVEEVVNVKVPSCPTAKVGAELGHGNTVLVGLSSPFWIATDHLFLCIIPYII